ncbi:MAG: zinc carboxypeptidase [Bdellovibrionales bacterium]|nr:zinc carboxypeptidase [Bdellovibrionales bacterium]
MNWGMIRTAAAVLVISQTAFAGDYWFELKAKDKYERSDLAAQGFDIVSVEKDRVTVVGDESEIEKAEQTGRLISVYKSGMSPFDFPAKDEQFHNYKEQTEILQGIVKKYPEIATLESIGKTAEQREIWVLRLSKAKPSADLPATLLMGGHHAREHVSVEVPLFLAKYLIENYEKKNPRIVAMLESQEVFIIPQLNIDGSEYDIEGGKYKSWRKNRSRNANGTFGTDLNRNYGFGWGDVGASSNPASDTYHGPNPFSEPESQAVKNFIEKHLNISVLVSYHTFSELILWPWGHVDEELPNKKDLAVFKTMGNAMAKMTGYTPMKSGDLYLASGDTCDWAYGVHGIFAFTFELDPKSMWEGGFYPGQSVLTEVFNKNLEPALYMIESSKNPYGVNP